MYGGKMSSVRRCKFEGCSMFRERIATSLLSGKAIRIDRIRDDPQNQLSQFQEQQERNAAFPGMSTTALGILDFEASYLRLVEKLVDGEQSLSLHWRRSCFASRPAAAVGLLNYFIATQLLLYRLRGGDQ